MQKLFSELIRELNFKNIRIGNNRNFLWKNNITHELKEAIKGSKAQNIIIDANKDIFFQLLRYLPQTIKTLSSSHKLEENKFKEFLSCISSKEITKIDINLENLNDNQIKIINKFQVLKDIKNFRFDENNKYLNKESLVLLCSLLNPNSLVIDQSDILSEESFDYNNIANLFKDISSLSYSLKDFNKSLFPLIQNVKLLSLSCNIEISDLVKICNQNLDLLEINDSDYKNIIDYKILGESTNFANVKELYIHSYDDENILPYFLSSKLRKLVILKDNEEYHRDFSLIENNHSLESLTIDMQMNNIQKEYFLKSLSNNYSLTEIDVNNYDRDLRLKLNKITSRNSNLQKELTKKINNYDYSDDKFIEIVNSFKVSEEILQGLDPEKLKSFKAKLFDEVFEMDFHHKLPFDIENKTLSGFDLFEICNILKENNPHKFISSRENPGSQFERN